MTTTLPVLSQEILSNTLGGVLRVWVLLACFEQHVVLLTGPDWSKILILGRNFFPSNLILIGVAESNDNYITSFKLGNCFKHSMRSFKSLCSCRMFSPKSSFVNSARLVENLDFGAQFFFLKFDSNWCCAVSGQLY